MKLKFWEREQSSAVEVTEAEEPIFEQAIAEPPPPVVLNLDAVAIDEKIAIAKRTGCLTPDMAREELLRFVEDNGLHVFNTVKVGKYLGSMAEKASTKKWVLSTLGHDFTNVWAAGGLWDEPHYKSEPLKRFRGDIPTPVLMTIEKVKNHFGDRARFYVAWTDNDPFLGISIDDCALAFIERWDEPTFRS